MTPEVLKIQKRNQKYFQIIACDVNGSVELRTHLYSQKILKKINKTL